MVSEKKLLFLSLLFGFFGLEPKLDSLTVDNQQKNPVEPADEKSRAWWKDAVIYQIYLRSYQDSNHDGIGDIQGLIHRLDHLSMLGIDVIWLSPIHPSPDYDFGYDVSDYYGIHPQYGTLQDFEELMAACKRHNIKVVLDLVVNHTSEQHPWFIESRSSHSNPKRDWYLWADGKNDGPPNRWRSRLDESAWVYDKHSQQYYLHSFFKEQPDLNWQNPAVRDEVKKIMRFWLDKGVAGFRLDLANYLLKDPALRENPNTFSWTRKWTGLFYNYHKQEHIYDKDLPELTGLFRELRGVADPYDAVLIGEIDVDDKRAELSARYLGKDLDALNLAFNFDFMEEPFEARSIKHVLEEWNSLLPKNGQPVYTLSNHDKVRHRTRNKTTENARLAAMLLLTLKGTPVLYYGEEIGMQQAKIDADDMQDHIARVMWFQSLLAPLGRDGCRTPMQWNSEPFAGFSDKKPWVKMSEDYQTNYVIAQQADPSSLLSFYEKLLHLRKGHPSLRAGEQEIETHNYPDVLLYTRTLNNEKIWIALNFSDAEVVLKHSEKPKVYLSTYPETTDGLKLRPYEGMIWTY